MSSQVVEEGGALSARVPDRAAFDPAAEPGVNREENLVECVHLVFGPQGAGKSTFSFEVTPAMNIS